MPLWGEEEHFCHIKARKPVYHYIALMEKLFKAVTCNTVFEKDFEQESL